MFLPRLGLKTILRKPFYKESVHKNILVMRHFLEGLMADVMETNIYLLASPLLFKNCDVNMATLKVLEKV